jgi:hypothetical protein
MIEMSLQSFLGNITANGYLLELTGLRTRCGGQEVARHSVRTPSEGKVPDK